MSTTTKTGFRWTLEDATADAQDLIKLLGDYCERIEIAGSVRRGKASVKDIELVIIPKLTRVEVPAIAGQMDLFGNMVGGKPASVRIDSHLDQRLDDLAAMGQIFKVRPSTHDKGKWGERQKQFWVKHRLNGTVGYIPVELYIVRPPAQWGAILTIRTGPSEFSKALMGYIDSMTDFKEFRGRLVRKDDQTIEIETPEERDYFKVLGLRWMPPEKRTADALRDQVRFSRAREAQRKAEQRDKRMLYMAQEAILKVFERGILYFRLDTLREKIQDADMAILKKALDLLVADGRVKRFGTDLYALPGWDGVIDESPATKSATVADLNSTNITIKAITLHQPWAAFIAAGHKLYETRSWSTNYRGLIAIHAGKTIAAYFRNEFMLTPEQWGQLPEMALGAVVAIARLVDVTPTEGLDVSPLERSMGNFQPGRYAWKLELVKVFDKPIPVKGKQGLWDWDGWDGVIDENQAPKSTTVADLPAAGEQISAPVADPDENILSVRIRRELERASGCHRTVIIPRLGCSREEFESALWALKHFGEVKENHWGRLTLRGVE